jgi:ABC-2 type transport system permease protein
MKQIVQIAFKDLRIVSRDKAALVFLIGMPVLMGVFFGFLYKGMSSGESTALAIAIVDEDESAMSAKLIEHLQANDNVIVSEMEKSLAIEAIKDKKLVAVVVIPKGFGETAGMMWAEDPATIRIGKDPSRQAESAMLVGFLMEAAGSLIADRIQDIDSLKEMVQQQKKQINENEDTPAATKILLGAMFDSMSGFFENVNQVQQESSGVDDGGPQLQIANIESFNAFEKKQKNSTISKIRTSWDISFPAAILWGVMACAAGFAISLVRERTRGTLLRLQTAPLTNLQLILGKGLACFLAIIAVVVMMIGLGIALGMRPDQPILLALSTLCIAYCYVGIMMAMSVIGKSEEAVGGAGWAVNVVFAMIGGGMIPLAFMPGFMKTLSNFSPVAWSILSLEGAIWRGFSFLELLKPWGILLAIGSVGLAIGVFILQRRKMA